MVASYEEGQEEQTDVAAGDGPYSYRNSFKPPLWAELRRIRSLRAMELAWSSW